LAWHEVFPRFPAVRVRIFYDCGMTHPLSALQDRNVLKRAVVQCFKRPLVLHEAPLSDVSQNWWPLKIGFPTPFEN